MEQVEGIFNTTSSPEKDIFNKPLPIEQKMFFFDLRTTPRGDYLKITEKRNEHRNTIKIPATGLAKFQEKISEIIQFIMSNEKN